ncbi:hypothetical protein ACSBR1_016749 [Camellia fascicularis]
MKLFNWVHRKFHHKDGKKEELAMVTIETEKQVLLENVTLADVLVDGWRDGILTIGTFGFDPLSDFNQKNECPVVEKEEEEEEEEECEEEEEEEDYEVDNELGDEDMKVCDEEELNPLVFTAFRSNYNENALKDDLRMARELGFDANELEDEKRNKKRERTTLADLFSADSDDLKNAKRDRSKIKPESKKKADDDVHGKKKGLSFAKKLIPRVGHDTRPIKKLHQLMRRMLKRKIHPDLEGKFQKIDSQIKPTVSGLFAEEHGANESVSLLQTKDAVV